MKICTTYKERLLGLMFQKKIQEDYLFPNCKSIHTFFMRINIDIICLNKDDKIIKIYRNIPPNRLIFTPRETYSIIETNANSYYKENQVIKIKQ